MLSRILETIFLHCTGFYRHIQINIHPQFSSQPSPYTSYIPFPTFIFLDNPLSSVGVIHVDIGMEVWTIHWSMRTQPVVTPSEENIPLSSYPRSGDAQAGMEPGEHLFLCWNVGWLDLEQKPTAALGS